MRQTPASPEMCIQGGGGSILQIPLVSPRNLQNTPLLRHRHQKHPSLSHHHRGLSGACSQTAVKDATVSASKHNSRHRAKSAAQWKGRSSSATFRGYRWPGGSGHAIAPGSALIKKHCRCCTNQSGIQSALPVPLNWWFSAPAMHRPVSMGGARHTSSEHFVKLPENAAKRANVITQNTGDKNLKSENQLKKNKMHTPEFQRDSQFYKQNKTKTKPTKQTKTKKNLHNQKTDETEFSRSSYKSNKK